MRLHEIYKKFNYEIKPSPDDPQQVAAAQFEYFKIVGNILIKTSKINGGVALDDKSEKKRVDDLVKKIKENGYVSRLIVDTERNVIEGQHRFEALKILGSEYVPVTVIQDLSLKYNTKKMVDIIKSVDTIHPDNAKQLVEHIIDAIEDVGKDNVLDEYDFGRFNKFVEAVIKNI